MGSFFSHAEMLTSRTKVNNKKVVSPRAPKSSTSQNATQPKLPPVSAKGSSNSTEIESSLKVLNQKQRRAFRRIFDEFDIKNSKTITPEELHVCVNKLAGYEALSFQEVMQILKDMDVKGTGDIEFDEFIYFMTRPQNLNKMLTDEDRKLIEMETGVKQEEVHEADQREVLFHILRKVLEQDENRDIRNFYRTEIISKINDHVIDDWSDGKRCIGLSNAEMLKRYRNILRRKYREDSNEIKSPYCKPTMWGVNELRKDIKKQRDRREQLCNKGAEGPGGSVKPERVKVREMQVTVEVVPLPCYYVKRRPNKFTYDDLKQIRVNVNKLKKNYYCYLRETANRNAKEFHAAAGIKMIKNAQNRKMTNLAFQSYCNPFVVAPWVPSANPNAWRAPPRNRGM